MVPLYKFCHPGDLAPTICPPLDSGIAKHYASVTLPPAVNPSVTLPPAVNPSVTLPPAVNPQPTLSLLIILALLFTIPKAVDFEIACMMLLG